MLSKLSILAASVSLALCMGCGGWEVDPDAIGGGLDNLDATDGSAACAGLDEATCNANADCFFDCAVPLLYPLECESENPPAFCNPSCSCRAIPEETDPNEECCVVSSDGTITCFDDCGSGEPDQTESGEAGGNSGPGATGGSSDPGSEDDDTTQQASGETDGSTACEALDEASCEARADCYMDCAVPLMYPTACDSEDPPEFCEPSCTCRPIPDESDPGEDECCVVSSDGTVTCFEDCGSGGAGSADGSQAP